MHKLAEVLGVPGPEALYHGLVSHWTDPAAVVLSAQEPATFLTDRSRWADLPDFTQRMMFLDTVSYLPDDILVKLDRASMAVSLESRVPLLDHRVVEFAWRLPLGLKMHGRIGKWLLRQVLYQYMPKRLVDRPKMGFGVPLDSWLRGPLRPWAEALLSESRLRSEGFFDPIPIREKWAQHLSGRRNWQYHLWDVLMFQAWLRRNESTQAAALCHQRCWILSLSSPRSRARRPCGWLRSSCRNSAKPEFDHHNADRTRISRFRSIARARRPGSSCGRSGQLPACIARYGRT